jgi:hypothetical protein
VKKQDPDQSEKQDPNPYQKGLNLQHWLVTDITDCHTGPAPTTFFTLSFFPILVSENMQLMASIHGS